MNLTLAVDEATVERAREVARQQGTSLNALIREYIELLAGQLHGDDILAEFEAMWAEPGIRAASGSLATTCTRSAWADLARDERPRIRRHERVRVRGRSFRQG